MIKAKIGLTFTTSDPDDAINLLDEVRELIDNSGLAGIEEVWWSGEDIEE